MQKADLISLRALNRATLARQLLLQRAKLSAPEAVARLAGMQAQVPKPPFLGLWSRLADFTRDDLRRAIAGRELVRATMMRGTLHLVTREDFLGWRAALQPMLTKAVRSITKGATPDVDALLAEGRRFFEERPRTFDELRDHLAALHPDHNERWMAYTVRMHLPLLMVPDDSLWSFPASADFTTAESFLGESVRPAAHAQPLALRYLAAFGPATPADFQAWSGLGNAKPLFEELRPQLVTFRDERKRELFDLPGAPRPDEETPSPVRFLPEYDNLLLAHADRARVIADEHRPRVVTKNLRVLATFLVDGVVAGTWTIEKKQIVLEPFGKLARNIREQLEDEGERLAQFATG